MELSGPERHEAQIRDRVTRLTVEDIKTLRSQNDHLNSLTDEEIRILRGEMRRLKRDGYANERIAYLTGTDETIVGLLFGIRQLEVE